VGASPKSIPTDFEDIQWAAFVEKFERKETPITNLIPRGKEAYTGNKIRVAQKYNPFLTTTIKVLTANNSQNVDVVATAGMRVGDILRITDYQSGSTTALDYSTIELARIESITDSDTVVLTRDMDKTSTGSWPVHPRLPEQHHLRQGQRGAPGLLLPVRDALRVRAGDRHPGEAHQGAGLRPRLLGGRPRQRHRGPEVGARERLRHDGPHGG
jgi:hypothetical protein